MLAELRVRDLGVIADLTLVLDEGMTALTGEKSKQLSALSTSPHCKLCAYYNTLTSLLL